MRTSRSRGRVGAAQQPADPGLGGRDQGGVVDHRGHQHELDDPVPAQAVEQPDGPGVDGVGHQHRHRCAGPVVVGDDPHLRSALQLADHAGLGDGIDARDVGGDGVTHGCPPKVSVLRYREPECARSLIARSTPRRSSSTAAQRRLNVHVSPGSPPQDRTPRMPDRAFQAITEGSEVCPIGQPDPHGTGAEDQQETRLRTVSSAKVHPPVSMLIVYSMLRLWQADWPPLSLIVT